MSQLLGMITQGLGGMFGLGDGIADTVLGLQGLFSKTLDAVSSLNPFGTPSAAPGARAEELEARLIRLEALLAQKNGLLETSQEDNLLLQEKLTSLKQLLANSTLLEDQQTSVFGMVAGFLSNRDIAERLGKTEPDQALFLENLERTLTEDCHMPAPEVRTLVQDIGQLTSELKWAA